MSMGSILTLCTDGNFAYVYMGTQGFQMTRKQHLSIFSLVDKIVVFCEWWYLQETPRVNSCKCPKCFIIWTEWRCGQRGEIDQNTVQLFPKTTLALVGQSQKSVLLLSEVEAGIKVHCFLGVVVLLMSSFSSYGRDDMQFNWNFSSSVYQLAKAVRFEHLWSALALPLAYHYRFLLEVFISRVLGCGW